MQSEDGRGRGPIYEVSVNCQARQPALISQEQMKAVDGFSFEDSKVPF